jgi:penicillin-binding protein A
VLGAAVAAFVAGAWLGSNHEPSERRVAARFAAAWEKGDFATMHGLLAHADRVSLRRFTRAYQRTADTATLTGVRVGRPRSAGGSVVLSVTATTRIFGSIKGRITLPMSEGADGEPAIAWRPDQTFPGLRQGERLRRRTRMPARATIQARDGTAIAKGEARLSDLGPVAAEIAGRSARRRPSAAPSSPRSACPPTPTSASTASSASSTASSPAPPAARCSRAGA